MVLLVYSVHTNRDNHGIAVRGVESVDGDDASAVGGLNPGPALIFTEKISFIVCFLVHGIWGGVETKGSRKKNP